MARSKASGYSLTTADVSIVLGMVQRGDRDHDIAAWFGVNQGRIAEAKDGKFGNPPVAPADKLPPKGPPGVKGKRLRAIVRKAIVELSKGDLASAKEAAKVLQEGADKYDAPEM